MKWRGGLLIGAVFLGGWLSAPGQSKVVVPEQARPEGQKPVRAISNHQRILYPWKQNVTTSVFWIGESKEDSKSAECVPWDADWKNHFGGTDDPDPSQRITDRPSGDFRPKSLAPKLNPFYVALPYNDLLNAKDHKPDADQSIPWAARIQSEPGKSRCKGRWVQIFFRDGRTCFAQWEACGPSFTDDSQFVFGDQPPKNEGAGIAVSPAIRDYLELAPGDKVHWRFVEAEQVSFGPWRKYGPADAVHHAQLVAQQRYLEYLRKKEATPSK